MPNPIRTDGSNRFARDSIARRYPSIVDEMIRDGPDLPPAATRELTLLRDELKDGAPLRLFAPPAPDYDVWSRLFTRYAEDRWLDTEWFFGDHLFFRRILQAVRWWEIGVDPFAGAKEAENRSPRLADLMAEVAGAARRVPAERLTALLELSLWGNRADLSNPEGARMGIGDPGERDSRLVIDERGEALRRLPADGGEVSIVTDNCGIELAVDLSLADALIALRHAPVYLHLKMHPTYVSDATAFDVRAMIALFRSGAAGREAAALGGRLAASLREGSLRLAPDLYWNLPCWLSEAPPRIARLLERSLLVILKGDANYRRLVRDTDWAPGTPLADAVSLWAPTSPSSRLPPILALRALKSDPLPGIEPDLAKRLDRADPAWRTNARFGIAQLCRSGG